MSKEKITVVKLGGNCMDNPELLQSFLASFPKLEGKKILVHGGGKLATSIGNRMGIPAQMREGRRITCAETIKVVTMVYAGLINKDLVTKLQALKCNAIGLSGADGNLIRSEKKNAVPFDYGFVGDPVVVNSGLLCTLLENDFVPVIAPITHNTSGQLLNTNADTIASVIASALANEFDVHLLFAFDRKGVLADPLDDTSVITQLNLSLSESLKAENKIAGGMHPKLNAGFNALQNNVARVTIQHLSSLESTAESTTLTL